MDLGSSMGTTLNGRTLLPSIPEELFDDDKIAFGQGNDDSRSAEFTFVVHGLNKCRPDTLIHGSFSSAERNYAESMIKCLEAGLARARAAMERSEIDAIWKSAGTVKNEIYRIGQTYQRRLLHQDIQHQQAQDRAVRQQQRLAEHNPLRGTARAHRRRRAQRQGLRNGRQGFNSSKGGHPGVHSSHNFGK